MKPYTDCGGLVLGEPEVDMTIRVQMTMEADSGLPEDRVVNVWHTRGSKGDPAGNEGVADIFRNFYIAIGPLISGWISRADAPVLSFYDLADPEPRVPFYEQNAGFPGPASSDDLPTEVAICTSFRGNYISGTPNARRRGRIYVGPLTQACLGDDGRPATTARDTIAEATEGLVNALLDYEDGIRQLVVYSRVDNQASNVTQGWVDNEFDTQRRRGRRATARTRWFIG